jgi:hypothetical protein
VRRPLLVVDVVEVEPTRRVSRRRAVPELPLVLGEKPLYWWSMSVPADGEWHHVFVSDDAVRAVNKSKKKVFGYCDFELRLIVYARSLLEPENATALRATFRHETYHARAFGNPHSSMSKKILGRARTLEAQIEREEVLIDHLTAADDGLFDEGVLRLPPLPKQP